MKDHKERIAEFIESVKGKQIVQLSGGFADLLKMKFDLADEPTYSISDDPIPRLIVEVGEKRMEVGLYFATEKCLYRGKIKAFINGIKSPLGQVVAKDFILNGVFDEELSRSLYEALFGEDYVHALFVSEKVCLHLTNHALRLSFDGVLAPKEKRDRFGPIHISCGVDSFSLSFERAYASFCLAVALDNFGINQ